MNRRKFLGFSLLSVLMAPIKVLAAIWNKAAFEADNLADAKQGLSVNDEIPSQDIEITAPAKAENGAIVQVAVDSHIPNTEAIAIFVENNPTTLIGNYMFSENTLPKMVARIKMAETSDVKVIVKSGNRYYTASKQVEVLENGCDGSSSINEQFKSSIKVRAKLLKDQAGVAQVKAIITHPMHTGYVKDARDQYIPAHFIQLITIKHNEQTAVDMQLGTGIAKNPYLTFHVTNAKLGEQVTVIWHDNLGNTGQKTTTIIA